MSSHPATQPRRVESARYDDTRLDPLFADFLRNAAPRDGQDPPRLREWVELAEAWRIARALRDCRGNRSAAARALGIGRRTLYTKMEKLGLAERWDAPILEASRR
jgi:DNA-binding NtrC family response regulator